MKTYSEMTTDLRKELLRLGIELEPGDEQIILRRGIDWFLAFKTIVTPPQERLDILYLITSEIKACESGVDYQ